MSYSLFLRNTNSPYGDINKGSVLSQAEVDNNFIFLKGDIIYTATTGGGMVTLSKRNGETISWIDAAGVDTYVTGGTYSNGTATFMNTTGGTFNVTGFFTGVTNTNLGRILYVSISGNNSTAIVGDINKPFLTLYAAKTASISGDTIHVFPQTFTFDNRTAAGLPYNDNQELINLWKAGVNYYFELGCKIRLYNQTVTGQEIYLMRPSTGATSTCNIYGLMEYEQYSEGVNTFDGDCFLYNNGGPNIADTPSYEAVGNTCLIQGKSFKSFCNELVSINRDVAIADKSIVCKVTIVADVIDKTYIQGESGAGSSIVSIVSSDATVEFNSYAKSYSTNLAALAYFRGSLLLAPATGNTTTVNIYGEVAKNTVRQGVRILSAFGGTINWNVKETYFNSTSTSGSFIGEQSFGTPLPFTININGNGSDYAPLTDTNNIFYIATSGHNITMNGNLTLLNSSGVGRTIGRTDSISTITINGNINYSGSGVTTAVMFKSNSGGVINYKGDIYGNFACPITNCFTGTITINNSNIKSTVSGNSSSIMANGSTSLGTVNIRNSYIELKNNTNAISNGSYVKGMVSNSMLVNTGSGNTLENTTAFGSLQLLNTTIISSGTSINYTSTSPVTSSYSTTNTAYNINTLNGSLATVTEITY